MQCLSCFNPTVPAPSPSSLRKGSMLRRRKLRDAGRVALPQSGRPFGSQPGSCEVRAYTRLSRKGKTFAREIRALGGLRRAVFLRRLQQVGEPHREIDAVTDLAG